MGQAKQRGTFEQRQADALIKLSAERAAHQKLMADRAREKAIRDSEERERIAALPEQQRQVYNRRGKSAVNAALMMGLALGAMNGFR